MTSSPFASLTACLAVAASSFAQAPGDCVRNDASFQSQEGGCKDLSAGLVWSVDTGVRTWEQALSDAANLVQGGYSDWRLPTIAEMQVASANGAQTHIRFTHGLPSSPARWNSWSSSPASGSTRPKTAPIWTLDWVSGSAQQLPKNSRLYFHCVRDGIVPASSPEVAQSKNEAAPSSPAASQSAVTHVLDGDRWIAELYLPLLAGRSFAATLETDGAEISAMPTSGAPASGTFDAAGRATINVDPGALRSSEPVVRAISIHVLVADPVAGAPRAFRVRLPR
ncbi:MAG: DUF1566 domain-containing protein [Planctomycetes bacterium]|nr:DUF1566 domain-containing protein [Planctomycetota bacterium]